MVAVRQIASTLLDNVGYWLDCGLSILPVGGRRGQRPHVVAVYFHGVLHEPGKELLDPQEGVTPSFLQGFIRSMKAAGYTFTTPDAVFDAERSVGNLALLSSDDGYRNVERLLPTLEQERVPVVVFLTTEYSRKNGICWWDQVYLAGCSESRIKSLLKHGVRSRAARDEALRHLGIDPVAAAFCDSHRLLSPTDVRRLTGNPHFCFGNHTRNHLSLPLLEDSHVQDEVEGARRDIEAWTGRPVHHFAFPYGDHDQRTMDYVARVGYRTVFTTEPGRFFLPANTDVSGTHVLPRYRLRADRSARWQVRIMSKGITAGSRFQTQVIRWLRDGWNKKVGS